MKLKDVMTKEKLNWRSFTGKQAINRQWNLPATPTYYVIDHQGVIRYKWVGSPGETAMDSALQMLIQRAERRNPAK